MIATELPTLERAVQVANRNLDDSPSERLERAERFLKRCGFHFFGVEYVTTATDDEYAYLNAGDTYASTLLIKIDDNWSVWKQRTSSESAFVSSWGDVYETDERQHCEEHNVIRCGYCSEFTPFDYDGDVDWHDCVCESCGNLVGG